MKNNPHMPVSPIFNGKGEITKLFSDQLAKGLTKREAFAMAAMKGILSNETIMDYIKNDDDMTVVNQSVDMADQLLAELSK